MTSFTIEDLVGHLFGSPQLGDIVFAELSSTSSVRGTLVAMPNATMGFCVVKGTITNSGESRQDDKILVPYNLLKLGLYK